MPAGFASPGIMFLQTWGARHRRYLKALLTAARPRGYTRYAEGASGAFAATLNARAAGYAPSSIETGDVWLYSAVVGSLMAGLDLEDLGVRVNGRLYALQGDPLRDAARILITQLKLRMVKMVDKADYHAELYRSLVEREDRMVEDVMKHLENQFKQLGGMTYARETPWDALRRVYDDPYAILITNPPCYRGQYEKVFDTGGALTWNQPPYEVWDLKKHGPAFMDAAKDAKALVFMLCIAPYGEPPGPVCYAESQPPIVTYLCCNRPEEAIEMTGVTADVSGGGVMEPLPVPVLPPEARITLNSDVRIVPIESKHARYYRDLWQHMMQGSSASVNWAVLVDDQVAGVCGYSFSALDRPYQAKIKWEGHLILVYGFGSPSDERRAKLVVLLSALRSTVEATCEPWARARATGVVSVDYTPEAESKGYRGTPYKLIERGQDALMGRKLIYATDLQPGGPKEALKLFVASEARRQVGKIPA